VSAVADEVGARSRRRPTHTQQSDLHPKNAWADAARPLARSINVARLGRGPTRWPRRWRVHRGSGPLGWRRGGHPRLRRGIGPRRLRPRRDPIHPWRPGTRPGPAAPGPGGTGWRSGAAPLPRCPATRPPWDPRCRRLGRARARSSSARSSGVSWTRGEGLDAALQADSSANIKQRAACQRS
jgi:hypothetical protein